MVSITSTPIQAVDFPTERQQDELLRLVTDAYPMLRVPPGQEMAHRREFSQSLFYCCHARRVQELATGIGFQYWLADCYDFLQQRDEALGQRGYTGRVTLLPFVAAIVASGIAFAPLTRLPFDLAFGLSVGGANFPSDAWKATLTNGAPKPTPLRNAPPLTTRSPVRIDIPSVTERR